MAHVAQNLQQIDDQPLVFGVGDFPTIREFANLIWCIHPVEWFVCATIGVNGNTAIGFNHDEARGLGQRSLEPTDVVDRATGNDETHVLILTNRAASARRGRASAFG